MFKISTTTILKGILKFFSTSGYDTRWYLGSVSAVSRDQGAGDKSWLTLVRPNWNASDMSPNIMSKWQDIVHGKCIEQVPFNSKPVKREVIYRQLIYLLRIHHCHDPRKYEEKEAESGMGRSDKYNCSFEGCAKCSIFLAQLNMYRLMVN